jgi:hypothetical protein
MSFFNNNNQAGSSGAFGNNPTGSTPASSNPFGGGTLGGVLRFTRQLRVKAY